MIEFLGDVSRWFAENWSGRDGYLYRTWEHLQVSGVALAAAALLGVPLGARLGHTGRFGCHICTFTYRIWNKQIYWNGYTFLSPIWILYYIFD